MIVYGETHISAHKPFLAASEETSAPFSCPSYVLARFLAAAGHIALQQVVHLETSVLGEIKRRERLKEDSKGEKKKRTSTSTSVGQTPKNKVNK